MNADKIVREARGLHADWVVFESMHHGGGLGAKSDDGEAERKFMLWLVDDFPVMCDIIESLQAQLAEKDAEIKRLNDEPPAYKFYYCKSEDSYLLGRRLDTLYYAHWNDGLGFVWDMSRYLPWGEHVVAPRTAWKEHTYPSEPKEVDSSEWFSGFLAKRLSDSQRREKSAVEDIHTVYSDGLCEVCGRRDTCLMTLDRGEDGTVCHGIKFEWRGPQDAEKGERR